MFASKFMLQIFLLPLAPVLLTKLVLLLIPQRHQRVDAGGTPRWNETRGQRDDGN
jgi:hypothetical protein